MKNFKFQIVFQTAFGRTNFKFTGLIIAFLVAALIWNGLKQQAPQSSQPSADESLQITSTNPNPLDEATILPTDTIEISFNKPIFRGELKHRFDPEIEHGVETVNGVNKEMGLTFRISFKKPLEMGKGYTLFILSNTHDERGHTLDHEYIYHFRTINYRGI